MAENIEPEITMDVDNVEDSPSLALAVDEADSDPVIELEVEVPDYVSAYNAEAWAVGERAGDPVGSSDPAYHNNAKYYAEQAEDAEAWAVGKRGGVDVGSTDPTYHNNSKYYEEQCAGVATGLASKADKSNTVLDTNLTVNGTTVEGEDLKYLTKSIVEDHPMEHLRREIMKIDKVSACRIYINSTDETDANGIPAKSISAVVVGGATASIAEVIFRNLPAGYGTYGSVRSVVDVWNIYLQRAQTQAISITMSLHPVAGVTLTEEIQNTIKTNIVDYIASLSIGEKITVFGLSQAINAVQASDKLFAITALSLSTGGSTYTEEYQFDWNARGMIQTGMIAITIV